jgi:hypothetical protein
MGYCGGEESFFSLSTRLCYKNWPFLADYGVLWREKKIYFLLSPLACLYNNIGFWLTNRACGGKFRPLV